VPPLDLFLTEPFQTDFMRHALLGGALVAAICAVVGTWVVIRGMAFLGEALGHGMLPGVALATVLGWPVLVGGALSAVAMSATIGALQRRGRLSYDTTIGLLFVGMLSVGVIVISHSRSFATDATVMLFGDVLAIEPADLRMLAVALVVTVAVAAVFHRSFVASAFDPRIARTLGLRPRLAQVALVGLVTLAVVASYQAVGSLLVIGLLLAPVVAAQRWTRRITSTMALAALVGVAAVTLGLLASWHAGTAAGASIACAAIGLAAASALLRALVGSVRRRRGTHHLTVAAALLVTGGCAAGEPAAEPAPEPSSSGHGAVEGAQEVAEPQLHLLTVDGAGAVGLHDLLDESTETLGSIGEPSATATDGRYLFATTAAGVEVVDSGVWTWDHGDHNHYYLSPPELLGTVPGEGAVTVATGPLSTAGGTGLFFRDTGEAVLLDNETLSDGEVAERFRLPTTPHDGLVAPLGEGALVTVPGPGGVSGLQWHDREGAAVPGTEVACRAASGTTTTAVGVVVGCADGAVLATMSGEAPAYERIPYPAGVDAPRATAFDGREGRPTVSALAGRTGFWLLDTRERRWRHVDVGRPLRQVVAADDEGEHVVALDRAGRVRVYSPRGRQLAVTRPLLPRTLRQPELLAGVRLVVDQDRAYLNAPAEGVVHEIDYADRARVARTLTTPTTPVQYAEVGR